MGSGLSLKDDDLDQGKLAPARAAAESPRASLGVEVSECLSKCQSLEICPYRPTARTIMQSNPEARASRGLGRSFDTKIYLSEISARLPASSYV